MGEPACNLGYVTVLEHGLEIVVSNVSVWKWTPQANYLSMLCKVTFLYIAWYMPV